MGRFLTRYSLRCNRMGEIAFIGAETSYVTSYVYDYYHPREVDICSPNLPPCFYTYIRDTWKFWIDAHPLIRRFQRNTDPWAQTVYPLWLLRTKVDQWKFPFIFVRLGYRNMERYHGAVFKTIFPPVQPNGRDCVYRCRNFLCDIVCLW